MSVVKNRKLATPARVGKSTGSVTWNCSLATRYAMCMYTNAQLQTAAVPANRENLHPLQREASVDRVYINEAILGLATQPPLYQR